MSDENSRKSSVAPEGVKMEGNDKKTILTKVSPPLAEQAKKCKPRATLYMLSYFAIVIAAYYLNIAESEAMISIVKHAETLIPSIKGTAAISVNTNFAKFVLVISWGFIIPFSYYLIKNADWSRRSENFKNIELLIIAFTLFLMGALWALTCKAPNNSGSYDRLLFNIIKSFTFGISIWGLIIWVSISSLLSAITILIVVKTREMFGCY
jgi:hypothetical protein